MSASATQGGHNNSIQDNVCGSQCVQARYGNVVNV